MDKKQLIAKYKEHFSGEPSLFFSPGRVNLIGEHIDYNGGYVFPAAITFGTYAAAAPRKDQKVRLLSGNFKHVGVLEFDLRDLSHTEDEDWSVFVKGVADQFHQAGFKDLQGFEAYVEGNIPNGAGLSSSASLELLTAQILESLNGLDIDMVEKVKMGQRAENEYVGVQCGIMDQFAIGMGKENYAIKLNTSTLEYDYALADLKDCSILIMNTNKRRELADSKYNERLGECKTALSKLQEKVKISHLCDLTTQEFFALTEVIGDPVIYRRAKHAVTENERVKLAISALAVGDLAAFGQLLNESHISLRDDYEVTGYELDTIVSLAWQQEGVLGARMTGAGFGGCAIALVKNDCLDQVRQQIADGYRSIMGYDADFYIASIGGGTKTLAEPVGE